MQKFKFFSHKTLAIIIMVSMFLMNFTSGAITINNNNLGVATSKNITATTNYATITPNWEAAILAVAAKVMLEVLSVWQHSVEMKATYSVKQEKQIRLQSLN